MATLRDVKRKIDAVKKTSQITKAMNMVAAAKLRVAQQNMEKFLPYADKFREVIGRLVAGAEQDGSFELMTPREEVKKIELVLLSADRGLCGSFNNNLLVTGERFMKAKQAEGLEVAVTAAGRKASGYYRVRRYPVREALTGLLNKPNYDDAFNLGRNLVNRFVEGESDEVYLVYSHFISVVKQAPTVIKLLPISPGVDEQAEGTSVDYIYEPSHQELLTDLLPNFVYNQLLSSFYETTVSEHAARMAAMDNATNNCKDLVRSLTLTYNKARQAAITTELMDIVGGAEALR
ncbi:MAG: ATP synthase F1 subunit gamma [Syntrophobacteraceae bacterium CG2_30_61_12]|nr:MAG: ATP synthase F1 subunit gamma [Syntrophobacteraceae bacterium CG2_30_61_12]PIU30788.1 MAG: ATP synthase F1 subunit gamma [Syntrophobacteraceae bacterium CG07_land_8_20_14_0_80_61_8]